MPYRDMIKPLAPTKKLLLTCLIVFLILEKIVCCRPFISPPFDLPGNDIQKSSHVI